MLNSNTFFKRINNFILDFITILYLCELITFKKFEFLKFIKIILLFFVDKLNKFEIFDDGHVDKKAIEHFFIGLKIIVVDFDH